MLTVTCIIKLPVITCSKNYTVILHLFLYIFQVVREAFFKDKSLQTKSSFADLVTEIDQAVEKQIINSFKEKYPTHK